jgi:hypothetical protein
MNDQFCPTDFTARQQARATSERIRLTGVQQREIDTLRAEVAELRGMVENMRELLSAAVRQGLLS